MVWYYKNEQIVENKIWDIIEDNYSEEDFEEFLNENYEVVKIGNLTYLAGWALRRMGPIAFRCGRSDEVDQIASDIIACKDDEDCFGFGIEWREE